MVVMHLGGRDRPTSRIPPAEPLPKALAQLPWIDVSQAQETTRGGDKLLAAVDVLFTGLARLCRGTGSKRHLPAPDFT